MTTAIFSTPTDPSEKFLIKPPPQALIRNELARTGTLMVRIIGAPGSGKTELIAASIKRLFAPRRVAVIVINPAAQRDADKLRPLCHHVESIDVAVPRAQLVWHAIQAMNLKEIDLILIEACGGLAPLDDLGQAATVSAFAISSGDDKAAEYHTLVENSSIVLLTQIDIWSMMKFNDEVFRRDVHAVNSTAQIFEVSAVTGIGMSHWLEWLESAQAAKKRRNMLQELETPHSDVYFG